MEIILKQDMPGLGFKDDIVTVKGGYGRNFLIPQGVAHVATVSAKKVLAETKKQRAFKEEKIKQEALTVAKALENVSLKIAAKIGTSGKIFGSVNNIQIAEAIKGQYNLEIDRKKIHVNGESIKEVGTYKAKVLLHKEVIVEVSFEVYGE